MHKTIFVAGDLHYGVGQTDVLLPFIKLLEMAKSIDASVFINGDLFNFWFESKGKTPEGCEPIIQNLKNAVDSGLQVTVLRGNRDFLMNDVFVSKTGVQLERKDALVIEELKVIITHGDQFDPSIKYRIFRKIIRSFFVRLLVKVVSTSFIINVIHYLRGKSNKKNQVKYQLPKNIKCPKQYRMILGHYHQEEVRKSNENSVVFCPAFDADPKVLKLTKDGFEFVRVV